MNLRRDTRSKLRSRSSTRTSRTSGDSITSPRMEKVGRFIVKSWAMKWACTKRHTNALGCSDIRSGAATRLVVDTGVHSKGWTREQALKYMHDYTALPEHEIETEVDR